MSPIIDPPVGRRFTLVRENEGLASDLESVTCQPCPMHLVASPSKRARSVEQVELGNAVTGRFPPCREAGSKKADRSQIVMGPKDPLS